MIARNKHKCIYSYNRTSVFSCDQAALRTLLSVRPPVTPFSQCSCQGIIMELSEVITTDKSDVHAKGEGQRSKVKVTEVKTIWAVWDCSSSLNSHMSMKWCTKLGIEEVPHCFWRSSVKCQSHKWQKSQILTRIERFRKSIRYLVTS